MVLTGEGSGSFGPPKATPVEPESISTAAVPTAGSNSAGAVRRLLDSSPTQATAAMTSPVTMSLVRSLPTRSMRAQSTVYASAMSAVTTSPASAGPA